MSDASKRLVEETTKAINLLEVLGYRISASELHTALAAFEAERCELEKDKERLEHLSKYHQLGYQTQQGKWIPFKGDIRQAIDAAIAKHKGEKG